MYTLLALNKRVDPVTICLVDWTIGTRKTGD